MKKIYAILVLGLFIVGCNSIPENEFKLVGELRGDVKDSTKIFLKISDTVGRGLIEIDTTYLLNGAFEFSGTSELPQLHYLFIDGYRGSSPLVIENGAIEFEAQIDSLQFAKIKGTEQNKMLMEFMDERNRMQEISKTFNDDLRKANAAQDTAAVQALREEYFELQEKSKNYNQEFIEGHPNSLMSSLLLLGIAQRKTLTVDEIDELLKNLSPEIQKTWSARRTKEILDAQQKTKVGAVAPEFSGPTPNGELLTLNEVKGKLTLIDFWAGWCKPCRMENPNIVSVYNKYKDKGLSVVGVSLDRNREQWLQAIADDGLEWNHVSNVQYFDGPIAKLYNINAIPAAFLLDENGVIVARDLRGPSLEAKVSELLN